MSSLQDPQESRKNDSERCPCCGHFTIGEKAAFEICDVCFWEDDGQTDADADTIRGGPNGVLSLTAARSNYRLYGACEKRFLDSVRKPTENENGA